MTRRAASADRADREELEARVREVVAVAPPLSDQQRIKIRAILSLRTDVPLSIDVLSEPSSGRAASAHFQVTATAS